MKLWNVNVDTKTKVLYPKRLKYHTCMYILSRISRPHTMIMKLWITNEYMKTKVLYVVDTN